MSPTEAAYDRLVTFLADPAGPVTDPAGPVTYGPTGTRTPGPVTIGIADHVGIRSVSVAGRLVVRHVGPVRERLAAAFESEHDDVVLDLSGLDDLDAAGLVALTVPLMACRRRGVRVTVVEPRSPGASRLLTLTGIVPALTAASASVCSSTRTR